MDHIGPQTERITSVNTAETVFGKGINQSSSGSGDDFRRRSRTSTSSRRATLYSRSFPAPRSSRHEEANSLVTVFHESRRDLLSACETLESRLTEQTSGSPAATPVGANAFDETMVESTDEQAANCIAWVSHISDFEPRLFRRLYGRAFQDIVQSLLPGLRPYEGNVQSGNRLRAAIVFAVLEALWMASPNGVASVQPGGCLWPRLYRGASTAGLLMLEVLAQKVCVYRRNYPSRFDIEAWTRLVNRVQHLQELLEGVNELIRGDWDQPVAASPSETS